MNPKVVARVLLTIGFLAASVGYSSWLAERTVFDPSATRGATQALLTTPAVQTMLVREIRTSLQPSLGASVTSPQLTTAINRAVNDPKFKGAFENAIAGLHEAVLTGGTSQITLDPAAVTKAIDASVAENDPAVAAKVARVHDVSVPLGSSQVPHIGNVGQDDRRIADGAITIAVVLIAGALLLARDRKTFRRAGRRTAFLAIMPTLVFVVAPHFLRTSHNSAMLVCAAILQAFGHRVILSIGLLAIAGASTWLVTYLVPKRAEPAAPTLAPSVPGRYAYPPDTRLPSETSTAPMPEKLYL